MRGERLIQPLGCLQPVVGHGMSDIRRSMRSGCLAAISGLLRSWWWPM
jgi:hypothetical protein